MSFLTGSPFERVRNLLFLCFAALECPLLLYHLRTDPSTQEVKLVEPPLGVGLGAPRHLFFHLRDRAKLLVVVGVAQLVERRSVAPNVAGSIPVSHPKNLQ